MGYIGNIITKSAINLGKFFNVTKTLEDIDVSLPTLIVGWKEVKEYFPNQDILKKEVSDNIFWTFSKKEKRHRFESDLNSYIEYVKNDIENKIKYKFFNFILSSDEKRNKFIQFVNNGGYSIYYNSNFLYLYDNLNRIIIGVSLKDIEYIGYNYKDFIENLNINKNNSIINDLKFIDEQSLFLIKDNIKIVPFLNYLENNDIY